MQLSKSNFCRIRVFDKSTGYKNASMLKESHFHSLSLYQLHTCRLEKG